MKVAISFDDGLLDQFKWARALHNCEIKGTFYICPFHVGHQGCLTLDQLKRMHDEWGHTIANHFWLHESPKGSKLNAEPVSEQILIRNMIQAENWLTENGFADGGKLVSLPFGSKGGKWTKEIIDNLLQFCDQIRDVGSGINKPGSKIITAQETTEPIGAPDDALVCYYFHGNCNTTDNAFTELLYKLREQKVEFTSMLEEAHNV